MAKVFQYGADGTESVKDTDKQNPATPSISEINRRGRQGKLFDTVIIGQVSVIVMEGEQPHS